MAQEAAFGEQEEALQEEVLCLVVEGAVLGASRSVLGVVEVPVLAQRQFFFSKREAFPHSFSSETRVASSRWRKNFGGATHTCAPGWVSARFF